MGLAAGLQEADRVSQLDGFVLLARSLESFRFRKQRM